MIPRTIHIVWVGPKDINWKYEKEIRDLYSDYNIEVWTEDRLDWIEDNEFVKYARSIEKWAFVSDYYRIKILEKYGGIYLDTDMMPVVKLEDELLDSKNLIMGYEFRNFMTMGFLAIEPGHEFLMRTIDYYDSIVKPKFTPLGNLVWTEVIHSIHKFGVANKNRDLGDTLILNRRAFGLWFDNKKSYFIHKHDIDWVDSAVQRWMIRTGARLSKITPAFVTNIMSGWQRHMTNKRFKEDLKGRSEYLIENKDYLDKHDFDNIISRNTYVNVKLVYSNKYMVNTLQALPNVKKVKLIGKSNFKMDGKFDKVNFTTSKTNAITYSNGKRGKIESDHNIIHKHLIANENILFKR